MIRVLLLTSFRFGSGRRPIFWRYVDASFVMVGTIDVFDISASLNAVVKTKYFTEMSAYGNCFLETSTFM